jgi:archaellum biogenesis ATPase FlaH
METAHLEKIFFNYLLKNKEYLDLISENYFDSKEIAELFKICSEFIKKYSQSPTKEQLLELVKLKGIKIDYDLLNLFLDVNLDSYDKDWLGETFQAWIEFKTLDRSVKDLIHYLKTTKISPENVKNVVETAKSIIIQRNNVQFDFDAGLDFFNPESHKQPISDYFSTGYRYMDLCGGFSTKTLVCLMAPPKVGKSWWLANLAANAIRNGHNTAVISLEMRDRKIIKRIGANLLNIKMSEYDKIAEDPIRIKNMISNFISNNNSFNIIGQMQIKEFPTSTASVPDIENYLLKIEELRGFRFKIIVVDYINILKNYRNPNTENTYMKIKQIAEDLRAMGVRNNWVILTATQVSRSGMDRSDIGMSDISESSALIHTVDQLYAIIQDPLMHANREYILKLVANRDEGYKNSKKHFNVDYDYGRIIENAKDIVFDDL